MKITLLIIPLFLLCICALIFWELYHIKKMKLQIVNRNKNLQNLTEEQINNLLKS